MKFLARPRSISIAFVPSILAPAPLLAAAYGPPIPPAALASQSSCFGTCSAVPAPCTPEEFHHQWGGTIRGGAYRFTTSTSLDTIWTAEDGGRVRVSTDDGASFAEQETPREVRETLRSVHFLRHGLLGWGISEDGYVIGTNDGGACWKSLARLDYSGAHAELWDVHFLSATHGFVAGEHVLKSTTDGGCTWNDETVSLPTGMTLADVEFYALDFLQDGSAFVGLVACEPGLILRRTDASSTWSVVLRHDSLNSSNNVPSTLTTPACCATSPCTCGNVVEVWDVEFSPESSLSNAVAYACSGLGNGCGVVYRGTSGGTSWAAELHECDGATSCGPSTTACTNGNGCSDFEGYANFTALYSIHAIDDDNAVACGYGAQMVTRDPTSGKWEDKTDRCSFGTQPLNKVVGNRNGKVWILGMWGAVRLSTDGGSTWTEIWGGDPWRLRDVTFLDSQNGWAVGQGNRVVHSSDGGDTWCQQDLDACGTTANAGFALSAIAVPSTSSGVAVGDAQCPSSCSTQTCTITQNCVQVTKFCCSGECSLCTSCVPGHPLVVYTTDPTGACYPSTSPWSAATLDTSAQSASSGKSLADVAFAGTGGSGGEYWAVGAGGLVLRSIDGGASWTHVPVVIGGSTKTDDLTGVAFLNLTRGVVVGRTASGNGVAYVVVVSGGAPVWSDVTPTAGCKGLNDVAMNGVAALYAVGDFDSAIPGATVLKYDTTTLKFVHVAAAEAETGEALRTVEVVPGSSPEVFAAGDDGAILWSQTGSTWCGSQSSTPSDAETNSVFRGMSFLSPTLGWAVGFAGGGTVILKYRP